MSDAKDLYRVVFTGNVTDDFSLERAKVRYGIVFRLKPEKVDVIFNGDDIILKNSSIENVDGY